MVNIACGAPSTSAPSGVRQSSTPPGGTRNTWEGPRCHRLGILWGGGGSRAGRSCRSCASRCTSLGAGQKLWWPLQLGFIVWGSRASGVHSTKSDSKAWLAACQVRIRNRIRKKALCTKLKTRLFLKGRCIYCKSIPIFLKKIFAKHTNNYIFI